MLVKGHFVSEVEGCSKSREQERKQKKGNWNAHMKEADQNTVFTIDPRKKRKKRMGGTSFSNSRQKRRREFKQKEETCIEEGPHQTG